MKKFFPFFLFIASLASSCSFLNPIKELECSYLKIKNETEEGWVPKEGSKERYIIDTRTGETFRYDDFTEKLISINGKLEADGTSYDTKTTIVSNKWKMEQIIKYPWDSKSIVEINLKTMEFKEDYVSYLGEVFGKEKSGWEAAGICKWIRPKTTEIKREK